jgi:predicted phage tail protein
VDRVILSPEVSQADRRERQETSLEEEIHGRVSKDAIKTADEAIDALAEQHRTRHPEMTHAQCVEYVITATEEGKAALCREQAGTPAQGDAIT